MATHLIIDGYNLLAFLRRGSASSGAFSEGAREGLLRELAAYRQRKGHTVVVIFDGWQTGQPTERREHRSGLEVIYSRRGERADQVVQRLAREFGSDCAVVSSDREIVNSARASGAFVLTAQEFAARLQAVPTASARPWQKEADLRDEPPRRGPDKKGNPKKLPKAQRKRTRQLRGF
jgi:hypothetical protein